MLAPLFSFLSMNELAVRQVDDGSSEDVFDSSAENRTDASKSQKRALG